MVHTEDDDWAPPDDEINELLTAVNEAEGVLLEAQEQRDKLRAALVEAITARGTQTAYGTNTEGELFRITVVSGESTKVDADALRDRIGARAFNTLSVRKLDMTKVEKAVAAGKLDVGVLAEVTTVTPRTSYPRLTRVG